MSKKWNFISRFMLVLPALTLNVIWAWRDDYYPLISKVLFLSVSSVIIVISYIFVEKLFNKVLLNTKHDPELMHSGISSINSLAAVYVVGLTIFISLAQMILFSFTDIGKWNYGLGVSQDFIKDVSINNVGRLNKKINESMSLVSKNIVDEERVKLTIKTKNQMNNAISCISKCNIED